MKTDQEYKEEFDRDGRTWIRNAISGDDLADLDLAASAQMKAGQRLAPTPALRRALSAKSSLSNAIARIAPQAQPVRVVAFNKTEASNWSVPWYQDRVIAVSEKRNVDGFTNWTNKSGVWHCEPPQSILEEMLFVRVHLDDTDHTNGAMQIATGSHRRGIVPANQAEATAHQHPIESTQATRGDVLILKMLTLHSSKPAISQTSRRVLRIDFATSHLPVPLEWPRIIKDD